MTAVAGWKHPGVTVMAAGDAIAVAGVPLCQARNDRLHYVVCLFPACDAGAAGRDW